MTKSLPERVMYNILNVVQWKGEHKRAHAMPSKPSHYFFAARCTTFKQGSPHDLTNQEILYKTHPDSVAL